MKALAAYQQSKTLTFDTVKLFEELYMKLAQQCEEMLSCRAKGDFERLGAIVDRALLTLGLMDQQIDLSKNVEIGARILHLHRFLFRALVSVKLDPSGPALDGLGNVFVEMAGIFAAMANPGPEKPGQKQA